MNYFKPINCLLLLTAFFILFSCATYAQKSAPSDDESSSIPAWADNPHRFYPKELYIVGVGTGDTRKAAEDNAIGTIAKVFQSDVKVDQTLIENYMESESKSGSDLSFTSQMLNRTSVASQQKLKNIRIEKAQFCSTDGLHYVLAVLDRAETEELYKKDIKNNDNKISEYFKNYKNSPNKLNKFAFLSKAKTITDINEILRQQYQIISVTGEEVPASIKKSELDKEMRSLLDQISVALTSTGETPAEVGDYVKETVGKIGFKIVEGSGDFIFKYSLDLQPANLGRKNTTGYNWKLTIEVKDNINNYSLKAFNINSRTIGISQEAARAKIMNKVKNELNNNFYKQFLNYINSL